MCAFSCFNLLTLTETSNEAGTHFLFVANIATHAGISGISVYPHIKNLQKTTHHIDIGKVGSASGDTVGQPSDGIDADMGLYSKIAMEALLCLARRYR